jgi:membrane-associated phospholipid phosphatase
MWNNSFNLIVIGWLNQYSQSSSKFNHAIHYIQNAYLFKGLAVIAVLWYFWFKDTDSKSDTRSIIVGTILSCIFALFLATVINFFAPFQQTPILNEAIKFQVPIGLEMDMSVADGHGWLNSFPSHHATLFFALATGIFLISRPVGSLVFLYVVLIILIPRIYLGLHYPMDIIAGAVLGILTTILINKKSIRFAYADPCMRLLGKYPAAFQTVLFFIAFEIGVLFNDMLGLIKGLAKYLF